MKKSLKRAALVVVALLAVALLGGGPVGAHGGVTQAGYTFVFGAMDEPMITGQRTWLELRVNDEVTKEPVLGLQAEQNLTVSLAHETHEMSLPMAQVRSAPGTYKAAVWFTQAGEYPVIVKGKTASGEPFELNFKAKVTGAQELYGPDEIGAAPTAAPAADISLTIGNKEIMVNGVSSHMDVAPVIMADRTLVPLRFIAEAMGMPVHWDAATRTVHIGAMTSPMGGAMQPEGGTAGGHVDAAPHGSGSAMPAGGPDRTYELKMFIRGFKGVGGEIDGSVNPVLKATTGEMIRVNLTNGDPLEHDFVIDELGAHSDHIFAIGESTSATFMAAKAGSFNYYCSVPGHRKAGMEGVLEVTAK